MNRDFDDYKSSIRKLSSTKLLRCIHDIVTNKPNSLANSTYEKHIKAYIPEKALPFFAGQIARDTILYSNPHRNDYNVSNKLSSFLYEIFRLAKKLYIDTEMDIVNISEDEVYNYSSFFLRLGTTQKAFSKIPARFGRSIFLFSKLARNISGFDFEQKFSKRFGVDILSFLKSSVLICSLALRGYFNKNFSNKDGKLILPNANNLIATLVLLKGNQKEIREVHNKLYPKDDRFQAHTINAIRIKPILQPDITKYHYIAPIPMTILSNNPDIIYYNMQINFKNKFTDWFGDLFQTYVEHIFRKYIKKENHQLFTEKDIEKLGFKKENKCDLILADEINGAIFLVECKAARCYKGVINSSDKSQLFDVTSTHIKKAYQQIDNIARLIQNEKLLSQKKINKIFGLIITLDDLRVFNCYAVREKYLSKTNFCNFIHVLSIDRLENIINSLNNYNLLDIFLKLENSNDPDTALQSFMCKNQFLIDEIKELLDSLLK